MRLGAIHVLVAVGPSTDDGRGRFDAVHLTEDPSIAIELGRDDPPRLLWNDQNADPEACHGLRRFGRNGRRVGAPTKRLERPRPKLAPRLFHERSVVLDDAALQRSENRLGRFYEDGPTVLLIDAEALELYATEPPSDSGDEAAVRHSARRDRP